jgi:hypothetical protein
MTPASAAPIIPAAAAPAPLMAPAPPMAPAPAMAPGPPPNQLFGPPAAPQYGYPPPVGAMAMARPRRGRRGCLIALLIVAILILTPIALFLRLPQQLGIWRANPQAIFGQTPDPLVGEAVTAALSNAGSPTAGLRVYVFRDPASTGRILYATAALAENFSFRDTGGRDPILDLLGQMATAGVAADPRVVGVAVKVRDFEGNPMMIVTADAPDAVAYANGRMDEATFLDRVSGWVDPSVLAQSQMGAGASP